jgi:hypothetical protein
VQEIRGISLVFREMWDTTALNPKPFVPTSLPGQPWLLAVNTIANSTPRRINLGKLRLGFPQGQECSSSYNPPLRSSPAAVWSV